MRKWINENKYEIDESETIDNKNICRDITLPNWDLSQNEYANMGLIESKTKKINIMKYNKISPIFI